MLDTMRNNDGGRFRLSSAMRRPTGFTLVELIVVMVIIGIILVFMLNASMNALQTAREKATQGLIAKLDAALSDRVDAILQARVSAPTNTQIFVSQIYDGSPNWYYDPHWAAPRPTNWPPPAVYAERAYVLAQIELFQREMPDVFYLQDPTTFGYPLNFAANAYPIVHGSPNAVATAPDADARYVLPLGMGWPYNATAGANYFDPGLGIYGASYHVAAGLYKNLGYLPTGFDGVDNNGDGRVDEWAEGVSRGGTVDADVVALVQANLAAHTHKTARSEVMYALLVESQGPFGSILNRDDFTDLEVQDTDGDGLPEFIDAWGEPLQFYRWPLLFHSELQAGQKFVTDSSTGNALFAPPYADMIQQREIDPLDPNQQLMSPAWWKYEYNAPLDQGKAPPFPPGGFTPDGTAHWSSGVTFFENYFHLLHEPLYRTTTAPAAGQFWDRGAPGGDFAARRSFSSKFLVLSSGPDKQLGVFQYDDAGLKTDLAAASSNIYKAASPLLGRENLAAPLAYDDLVKLLATTGNRVNLLQAASANSLQIQTQGQDDINNHSIPAGGIGGSAP